MLTISSASAGFSGLPVTILKAGYKQLVPFLTKLFKFSIFFFIYIY